MFFTFLFFVLSFQLLLMKHCKNVWLFAREMGPFHLLKSWKQPKSDCDFFCHVKKSDFFFCDSRASNFWNKKPSMKVLFFCVFMFQMIFLTEFLQFSVTRAEISRYLFRWVSVFIQFRVWAVSDFPVFGSVRFSIFGFGSVRFLNRKVTSVIG